MPERNATGHMSTAISSSPLPSGSGPGGVLRVTIGDEQLIMREGVAALLQSKDGFGITGSTGDGRECVRMVLRDQPDLLIFDNTMSGLNGIEAVRRIGAHKTRTRVLCLSSRDDPRSVREAFDAGVHGYVAKRSGFATLLEAIDRVFRSGYYVSPEIAHVLVDGFRGRHDASLSEVPVLTAREREVARLYAEGCSTREIAERLSVSMKTVGTHREHVMGKIGARSIAQLTRYAIREGMVLLDE